MSVEKMVVREERQEDEGQRDDSERAVEESEMRGKEEDSIERLEGEESKDREFRGAKRGLIAST